MVFMGILQVVLRRLTDAECVDSKEFLQPRSRLKDKEMAEMSKECLGCTVGICGRVEIFS